MVLAINLPFELFLFAYAVLGPALTHDGNSVGCTNGNYFSLERRADFAIPVLMCILISL